ncbi:MAG TPA: O-methyltransferase [Phycisphaerae bacterium]|nr:O-methyltransferase [Phycisphaerae bacterium]
MNAISESYRKVPYDLREAKQVERRMLVDAFQRLIAAGFPIADYQYTGMGSIYFFDFALFHKYLGIQKMLSVEISSAIKKRVEFNKPYGNVEVRIAPISKVIPELSRDRKHILWLDYDTVIRADYARDIVSALSSLTTGSLLLTTVDVEPPGKEDTGPKQWQEHFATEVAEYLPRGHDSTTFAKSNMVKLNTQILDNIISRGMRSRSEAEFCRIFNFVYKDGHTMLTVGGMICTPDEKRRLSAAGLENTIYYRTSFSFDPCELQIPRFTRKERLHLDCVMPCADEWVPDAFEAAPEDIKRYRDVYRFLPSYAELVL